jgi:hypothetical protein
MKKIIYCICIFMLCSGFATLAQNQWGLKLYQNTDYFAFYYQTTAPSSPGIIYGPLSRTDMKSLKRISVAVTLQNDRHYFHELEFMIPDAGRPPEKLSIPIVCTVTDNSGQKTVVNAFALRYEISKSFTRRKGRLNFKTGIGVNPFYIVFNSDPLTASNYSAQRKFIGADFYIVPRLNYRLSKKFQFDLNIPINVSEFRIENTSTQNPALPLETREENVFAFNSFPRAFNMRLGLMYALN